MKIIDKSLKNRALGITALIVAIVLFIAACGNKSTGDISSPNYPMKPYPEIERPDWEKPDLEIPDAKPGYFNVTFDAGDYSYNIYAYQTIKEGDLATRPEDPEKIIPGLYKGNEGPSTFLHWVNKEDGDKWDFSTSPITSNIDLKAAWSDPPQEPIGVFNNNTIIGKAIDYVKAKPNSDYTLYLGDNAAISTQKVKVDGFNLTLKGIHKERIISLAGGKGALFTLGEWKSGDVTNLKEGMEFSIGENITLKGMQNNNASLVVVSDLVTFTMHTGSKITGNVISAEKKAAAVELQYKGVFNMMGGTITGNSNNISGVKAKSSSAVFVPITSVFRMEGGSITGNFGGAGEVWLDIAHKDASFVRNNVVLSGNSTIGSIALFVSHGVLSYTHKRSLEIISGWETENDVTLNIALDDSRSEIAKFFPNKMVLDLTSSGVGVASKINLGYYYTNSIALDKPIGDDFSINIEGKLIAK